MKEELMILTHPKSSVSEAIKTIRTNLQFSSVDEPIKSILLTSSISGEGKSFISSNLALAFAQSGIKVLLVDCDMRCGRIHTIFHLPNEKGLSNLLLDDINKKTNSYIQKTEYDNLSVLTMGVVPPNPTELLASEKNKKLTELLEEKYDLVIYDGIPMLDLTDSLVMADLVDKIAVVCSYKQTPIELLKNTIKSLDKFRNKIAGVVVNKMPVSKNKYNHYYNRYYNE